MKKIDSQINNWLEDSMNWTKNNGALKVLDFIPDFDYYIGISWKVGIVENFPFEDFIKDAKSQLDIKNNRQIWHKFPQVFDDSDEGFSEISTQQLFKKFKVPYHDYKNDHKLPWNTRAIKILENKIVENLTFLLDEIPESEELILYWEDYYRFDIDGDTFQISKDEFITELQKTGFDATMYLYPMSKKWCLINLEDLCFNILVFSTDIKNEMGFLSHIEHFELTKESDLFGY